MYMNNDQNFNNSDVNGNNTVSQNNNDFVNNVPNTSNNMNTTTNMTKNIPNTNSINTVNNINIIENTNQNINSNNTLNNTIINAENIQNNIPSNTLNSFNTLSNIQSIPDNIQNINDINVSNVSNNISNNKQKKMKDKTKTLLFIVLAIILIVIIGIFVYSKVSIKVQKKHQVDLESIYDPDKPILIENKGKYGYIESDGKVILEPKYISASEFMNGYAVVKIDNPDESAYIEYLYQIVDRNGNVRITTEMADEPQFYSEYGIWIIDNIMYDEKLNKIISDVLTVDYIDDGYLEFYNSDINESGIMTYKGEIVFKWSGYSASADISSTDVETDELFASVRNYGEPSREIVISLKTGDVLFELENPDDNYLYEQGNGLFYYYNDDLVDGYTNKTWLYFRNNKLAYKSTEVLDDVEVYDYDKQILVIDYGYDYESLGKTQRYFYYDIINAQLLNEEPINTEIEDSINIDLEKIDLTEQAYGYKKFNSNENYGIMKGDKIIIPCEYDSIDFLNVNLYNYMKIQGQEIVLLEKDKKTIIMNLKNQKVLGTIDNNYVTDYEESTFLKATMYDENGYNEKGYVIYNLLSGKSMTFTNEDYINVYSNHITNKKGDKIIYYNTDLKQIYVATK